MLNLRRPVAYLWSILAISVWYGMLPVLGGVATGARCRLTGGPLSPLDACMASAGMIALSWSVAVPVLGDMGTGRVLRTGGAGPRASRAGA